MFAELAGAVSGGLLGQLAGKLAGGDGGSQQPLYYTPEFVTQMNDMLTQSMNNALDSSTKYTNRGIETFENNYNKTETFLKDYLKNAISQSSMFGNQGLNNYQTAQRPFGTAGYDALDAYKQSLGLSTPREGSANQVQASGVAQSLLPALQALKGNYANPGNSVMTAPDRDALMKSFITPDQINKYIGNMNNFNKESNDATNKLTWSNTNTGINPNIADFSGKNVFQENAQLRDWATNKLTDHVNQLYNTQNQAFQNYTNYNNAQTGINNIMNRYDPSQQQAIMTQLKSLL